MSFGVEEIDLSMVDPETGFYNTARTYTVQGVVDENNQLRLLSIGQLVMAICLQRAAEIEGQIIALMDEMNTVSAELQDMTKIEDAVVSDFSSNQSGHAFALANVSISTSTDTLKFLRDQGVIESAHQWVRNDKKMSDGDIMYNEFITNIESKMDEKNSFSQKKMIELQSLTNKRDQSYDMISNVLKSLNTTNSGNVNNFR